MPDVFPTSNFLVVYRFLMKKTHQHYRCILHRIVTVCLDSDQSFDVTVWLIQYHSLNFSLNIFYLK